MCRRAQRSQTKTRFAAGMGELLHLAGEVQSPLHCGFRTSPVAQWTGGEHVRLRALHVAPCP